jgi:hypothetical protein
MNCAVSHMLAVADKVLSNRGEEAQQRDPSMNVWWIVVGLTILGAVATRMVWPRGRPESDLGFVSHQWLAEHRLSQTSDSHR